VGYVLIPTLWDETIAERTRDVLDNLMKTPITGLIVDMRINGGGAFSELYDLLSLFTQGDVGAFYQRGQVVDSLVITPDPIANSQDIPMIILVGQGTESYAEVFSGVLQARNRAVLVGEFTAGNVETVYPYDLEDGSRLWLAEETFAIPGVPSWEDKGVRPDIHVPGDWEDITDEDDPSLVAAVTVLLGDDE
jgi:carboxyl-terminal processing protease